MAQWKDYKIIRKMANGVGSNGQIIDLRSYSNGLSWKNAKIEVGCASLQLSQYLTSLNVRAEKLDDNRFKLVGNTTYHNTKQTRTHWAAATLLPKGGDLVSRNVTVRCNEFFVYVVESCWTTKRSNGHNKIRLTIKQNDKILEDYICLELQTGENTTRATRDVIHRKYDEPVEVTFDMSIQLWGKGSGSGVSMINMTSWEKLPPITHPCDIEWFAYEA